MNSELITRLVHSLEAKLSDESVELIETHISWVLITDQYAYKIKKPIKYSFLDYTTLELRKFYCERELELNKRLTHDMYLGVVPVSQKDSQIYVGEAVGSVIDYAVKMEKQDISRQMNGLLEKNEVSHYDMRNIAATVSLFHSNAQICRPSFAGEDFKERFNDILSISDYIIDNLGTDAGEILAQAVDFSDQFLDSHESLFINRIEHGFVRDLHGDLHSKNIFLYEDPVIFDCIDFNDSFRRIDVLDEIAFFCMDLDAYHKGDLVSVFMENYLEMFPAINNQQEEDLFVYYKCYRANIRAKVNALRAQQAVTPDEKTKWLSNTEQYLRLMKGYVGELYLNPINK
ncbi:MAG: hypothetical protein ABJF11_00490 [Reichenbachiella sp.]|uniref:hypothetical protein n=1 Tax=Reichenbachiella sp. TaxID=2184521 RepID=UPI003267FC36